MSVLAPKPKRTMVVDREALKYAICVWQLPNGGYVRDDDGDYFCASGRPGDKGIEERMRQAVKGLDPEVWPGLHDGKPFWLPGFRKVSQSEWEDQMYMLMEGYANPDPVDTARQLGATI